MHCPFCNTPDTKVVDSRWIQENGSIKRRRKCDQCDRRFTTFETIAWSLPMVVKSDGRREPFSSEKILQGVIKACQKRPVPMEQIEGVVNSALKFVRELQLKEVKSEQIGEIIMETLREIDSVAYVRFASVYKKFQDVNEFLQEWQRGQYKTPLKETQRQVGDEI